MRVEKYNTFEDLPRKYDKLFEEAERENFFNSLLWYRALADTVLGSGEELRLYGVEDDTPETTPVGLFVARVASGQRAGRAKRCLNSFDTFYTLRGGPILRPSAENQREVLRVMFASIYAERPRWDVISLKLLDRDSPVFDYIVEDLRAAGMFVEPYFQFGNWYEELTGRSFDAYVADRGKSVRKNLSWMYRRLTRSGRLSIALVTDEVGLENAIEAYRNVYAASWKPPEEYPNFIERLVRDCAAGGYLRLGNLYLDGQPVATQLNIVFADQTIIYKTAYDKRVEKNLSTGGLLTLHLMQHLIDVDRVSLIDFGLGDEPYKKSWMSKRRERWGVMAYNMRTVRGALSGHIARSRNFARILARKRPRQP